MRIKHKVFHYLLEVQKQKHSFLRFIFPILFILGFGHLVAQKPFHYTLEGKVVKLDTLSIFNVEEFGITRLQADLGNSGSASYPLVMDVDYFLKGDYSVLSFQKFNEHRKYSVFKPVTDASYITGSKLEQHFNIYHTQNFSNKSTFSIGFDKINAPGYYLNQATNNSHFYFNTYASRLGKMNYHFDLNIDYSNLLSSLNGGIVNDSDFVNDVNDIRNRQLLDVNLANASQQFKKWKLDYQHGIELWSDKDSLGINGRAISLEHGMSYIIQSRDFYDSILNTSFYNYIIKDTLVSNDVISNKQISTELGLKMAVFNAKKMYIYVGANPSYNLYEQDEVDTSVLDIEGVLSLGYETNKWNFNVVSKYLVNDVYENKDFSLKSNLGYQISPFSSVHFSSIIQRDRVALDLLQYSANNIIWTNTFEKQTLFNYTLDFQHHKAWSKEVKFNYFDIKNPIFFGYDTKPNQAIGFGQVLQLDAKIYGLLGKRWWVSANVIGQEFGGYNVFFMPRLVGKIKAAYNFKMFKKKLDLSLGLNLTYFSKYKSKDFDPVTGQFYIASEQEVGAYPYADVFIKGRVQRATFFVMSSHPHQGLLGYNYYSLPHYPGVDRVIRVGVSWMFLN